jgi:DNA-binding NtrC family response regulator
MTEERILNDKKILAVDDESDVLETLEELLSMCEVSKVTGFEEAKQLLQNQYFDIAILDIMGVDGYRLLEIARGKRVIPVMLTAHALNPKEIVKSYKEGAASYVPKEELANIAIYLSDILEAKEKGKSLWWRWYERFSSYFELKFGSDWQKSDKEFWEWFKFHI